MRRYRGARPDKEAAVIQVETKYVQEGAAIVEWREGNRNWETSWDSRDERDLSVHLDWRGQARSRELPSEKRSGRELKWITSSCRCLIAEDGSIERDDE